MTHTATCASFSTLAWLDHCWRGPLPQLHLLHLPQQPQHVHIRLDHHRQRLLQCRLRYPRLYDLKAYHTADQDPVSYPLRHAYTPPHHPDPAPLVIPFHGTDELSDDISHGESLEGVATPICLIEGEP